MVAVRPSTAWEEYDSEICGPSPPGTAGLRTGYDQVRAPDEVATDHSDDGVILVAA